MSEITTERLVLRAPVERDLPAIADLLSDIAVSRMLARVPHPYRLDDARRWYEAIRRPGAEDWRIFVIGFEGRAVGSIGFRNRAGEQTIGYWLGRPYWGRGLMSETARAAIEWFFSANDDAALYSGVFEDNPASLRIQEKLGFEVIGNGLEDCVATGEPRRELKTRLWRGKFLAGLD